MERLFIILLREMKNLHRISTEKLQMNLILIIMQQITSVLSFKQEAQ